MNSMNIARVINKGVDILLAVVESFLGLRFVLKLFGANPSAEFVSWLYSTSEPLLEPFKGMFPAPIIERGFILEFSTLFAMLMYALGAWLITELIVFIERATK